MGGRGDRGRRVARRLLRLVGSNQEESGEGRDKGEGVVAADGDVMITIWRHKWSDDAPMIGLIRAPHCQQPGASSHVTLSSREAYVGLGRGNGPEVRRRSARPRRR
ncbi:hypothetical protein NL676_008420 [Syzygium grande]|nr:hypothetical protein NL676_008420 [Syzygium grande]